jgi:hypothetical protein
MKSRLSKLALEPAVRGQRLGNHRRDARTFTFEDLVTLEVAAVRQHGRLRVPSRCLRGLGHCRQLPSVSHRVGHLVRNDQVVLGITAVCTF